MPSAASAFLSRTAPCRTPETSSSPSSLGDVQQHKLLENIKGLEVFGIFTVFVCLASSEEYYKDFILVCKKLSHGGVSPALVLSKFATFYKALFDE